jgi:hypothetical protein
MTGPQQTLTLTKRGEGAARAIKLSMMTTYTDRLCVCCGERCPWPLRGTNVAPRCQACRRGCSSQQSEPCQKIKKA